MPIDANIVDKTTGESAKVDIDHALSTIGLPYPPPEGPARTLVFREFLANSAGASDMRVDGSVTPVDFSVESPQTRDLYITALSFLIADAGAVLNEFGNIGALANGCSLFYSAAAVGEIIINDSLTTNFEFVRLCLGTPSFGDGTSAFRASNVSGMSEGYIPVLRVNEVFGIPFGVCLRRGSTEKLTLRVRDDVTGVDAFNCIAYGFERIVDT